MLVGGEVGRRDNSSRRRCQKTNSVVAKYTKSISLLVNFPSMRPSAKSRRAITLATVAILLCLVNATSIKDSNNNEAPPPATQLAKEGNDYNDDPRRQHPSINAQDNDIDAGITTSADNNEREQITIEEEMSHFVTADSDGDGKLSYDEIRDMLAHEYVDLFREDLANDYDANDVVEGEDREEVARPVVAGMYLREDKFLTFLAEIWRKDPRQEVRPPLFREIDTDGDGRISIKEAKVVIALHIQKEREVENIIDMGDRNMDGYISWEEFYDPHRAEL
eukprot:CAMPEP_0172515740 /NCGR_PEP_ID=MMETSP1066-20121228/270258_1 /TAXON_ID=671091 /ORGANISM="Coscinodiscus wailesii, Strain CCMP2513" /LENGTH=277 /DNA_ID=CAMNT_0013296899 /DNA_START=1 /DNA_END=834 /DNA_ORIENTATION=-